MKFILDFFKNNFFKNNNDKFSNNFK